MAKRYVCKACGKGVVAISRTFATRHLATGWQVLRVYRQGFESRVWTKTDIFGARSVSLMIRIELEIRSSSVNASETAEHAANSSFQAKNTNAANATVTCATRTER